MENFLKGCENAKSCYLKATIIEHTIFFLVAVIR